MSSILKVNTLQDAGGNTILSSDGAGTFTSNLGDGITEADMWRLNADTSGTSSKSYFTANFERVDTTGFGYMGTGMTESSGVFSFPSTGIYYVSGHVLAQSNVARASNVLYLDVTTNNSTYTNIGFGQASFSYISGGSVVNKINLIATSLIDVTDISNVKVKFAHDVDSTGFVTGNTDANKSFFTFIRLGDT